MADFACIVSALKNHVAEERIDLADHDAMTVAIENSLSADTAWPKEYMTDILVKGCEKYRKKFTKIFRKYSDCHDESMCEAYDWIVENIQTLQLFNFSDYSGIKSNAVIKCGDGIKNSVRNDIYLMLLDSVEYTSEPERDAKDIHIFKTNEGLAVLFPVDVWGDAYGYVQSVADSFKFLKKKYISIGISGLVYYHESISYGTAGAYFSCNPEDTELYVTYRWQKCYVCGKIIIEDTFYNSSQWDFGEGNEYCLCSSACMREHSSRLRSGKEESEVLVNKKMKAKYSDERLIWEIDSGKAFDLFLEECCE